MNRQLIAQLYEQYSGDVFRLALSYLHNRQDAEDICSLVFLKLMDKKVELLPGKEKAWLLTVAANECKNNLKSFWRKNREDLNDTLVFTNSSDRELWYALGSLSPKYRIVIHLYYFEGYTQEEISGILKLSLSAVQTRMNRARNQLKEVLKVEG